MIRLVERLLRYCIYLFLFLVPLVFYPYSSELFEFNKIIVTYSFTIIIVFSWLTKMILAKRIIFRRTILDIPLLIFLASQFLSTLVSIDVRTSILGYYSRFHGGLLSSIVYAVLYWAFVSNFKRKEVLNSLYVTLASATLVSIYGVFQHFGIDKDIWVQDVQNRVFSTLGQPNWLAAWLVALIPLTWAFAINTNTNERDSQKRFNSYIYWAWILLSTLFFTTLLYTKSRSGILGLAASSVLFWFMIFFTYLRNDREKLKTLIKLFLIVNSSFLIIALISGTPWTPSLKKIVKKKTVDSVPQANLTEQSPQVIIPALELGGTESGKIREIVWRGAIDIWKNYPILGSGVETFAFSYYKFRPTEHNLVSEWDYLYNKAHNEYLNVLATTGTIGIITYLLFIIASLYQISKSVLLSHNWFVKLTGSKKSKSRIHSLTANLNQAEVISNRYIVISVMVGYFSILATNFLGFSVVCVGLLFFLYPAMMYSLEVGDIRTEEEKEIGDLSLLIAGQKTMISVISLLSCYLIVAICRYWYADLSYSYGKINNESLNLKAAKKHLTTAVKISKKEAIYWSEFSKTNTNIAVKLSEQGDQNQAIIYAKKAISDSDYAIELSPANVNLKRDRASMFIKLAIINPDLLHFARETLEAAVDQAPTDAKLYYNLALSYVRTGNSQKAKDTLEKTIEMKPDYTKAYYALGLIYIDEGNTDLAKQHFRYILDNLDPTYSPAIKELEELGESTN